MGTTELVEQWTASILFLLTLPVAIALAYGGNYYGIYSYSLVLPALIGWLVVLLGSGGFLLFNVLPRFE